MNSPEETEIKAKPIRRKWLFWLQIIIIIYCGAGIALYYLQDRFLFHPKKLDSSHVFVFDVPFEELKIPFNKTGLLLGTGMLLGNGNVNPFFQNRIAATVQLMKAGKIENLIISGDNGRVGYDEPSDMRNQLIAAGIDSTRIYLDYAGFRTYDSMVRAKKIFGQTNLTVISQLFHNERAIYIAESFGMNAIGYNAADVEGERGEAVLIRERLARVNAWLDVLVSKDPHFFGPQVTILP